MPSIRASAATSCAPAIGAALALLAGCASSRLSSQPAPAEHLAGDWKLDVAHSDDLGKSVEELRAQVAKARHSRAEEQQDVESYRRQRSGGSGADGQEGGRSDEGDSLSGGGGEQELGPGPMPGVSPVGELMSNVPRGDYLRISVSSNAFTVISGDSSNQYTPGLESEISAEQGDAQQISGWKGTAYVIDTRPQLGPEIIQTFDLTKDGKLAMTMRLSGGGIHFTFARLYDRTTRVAPLAPPTTN
ncbi:MAG TPA: hypothetical protein VJ738_06950 [Steroidobacteraceae bacterium]|nr:hypothetical protein [Steroidobacteraceae bacterium]